jgi:hypothetical protein
MLRVKKVTYVSEYKLKILFSNGKQKIIDFEEWLSEPNVYLKPLRDLEFFKKVHLDDCKYSICWPNGADFSPDVLYEYEVIRSSKLTRPRKAVKRVKSRRHSSLFRNRP